MSERDDKFTVKGMRAAYNRYLRGLPMSRKETMLAMVRFMAIHAVSEADYQAENVQSEDEADQLRNALAAADKLSRARIAVIERLLNCLSNQGISLGKLGSELQTEVKRTVRGSREFENI